MSACKVKTATPATGHRAAAVPATWVSGTSVPSPGKDDRINTDGKADTPRSGLDCPRKDPTA